MAARLPAIADALVTWLNDPSRGWPLSFTATRTYTPLQTFEDLDDSLLVEVVPPEFGQEEPHTRGTELLDYTLFIGVRQRYTTAGAISASWVDARVELVELIADALKSVELSSQPANTLVRCESAAPNPTWDAESLQNKKTFLSVIDVVMREYRER